MRSALASGEVVGGGVLTLGRSAGDLRGAVDGDLQLNCAMATWCVRLAMICR